MSVIIVIINTYDETIDKQYDNQITELTLSSKLITNIKGLQQLINLQKG